MCKDNAARHGLKVGDMVGILGPTTPSFFWKGNDSYIGRIGRIKAFGSGVNEGQCAVFVNGKHWLFPESSLCKISPHRGRKKPRRKTAPASGCKEYTAGALASVPESPWQAKAENWRVMFPDGQNVKLEDVSAGAGSEMQPEAPKFAIGERVWIYAASPKYPYLEQELGASGEIVGVRGIFYLIKFDEGAGVMEVPPELIWYEFGVPTVATEPAPEPEKPKFRPFDKVLVRNADSEKWKCELFSYYETDGRWNRFKCTARRPYSQCIPFEGNEALLGTTSDTEKG